MSLNKRNKKIYLEKCTKGQYFVWYNVFECAENLLLIKTKVKLIRL